MVESVVFIDTEPSSAERNGQRHQHDPVRRHRQARPPRQVAGMTTQGVASEKQDGDRDGVRRTRRRHDLVEDHEGHHDREGRGDDQQEHRRGGGKVVTTQARMPRRLGQRLQASPEPVDLRRRQATTTPAEGTR
jgi:hypothetical protein